MKLAALARAYQRAGTAEAEARTAAEAARQKRVHLELRLEEALKEKGRVVVDGRLYSLTRLGSLVVEDVEVMS